AALAWLLSAAGVFVRDVQQLVIPLSQVLLFLSPVFYAVEMLPARLQPWFELNPLAWAIDVARGLMLAGVWPDWVGWALWLLIGAACAGAALWCFQRVREGFADVL